jgi:hypothetical protein
VDGHHRRQEGEDSHGRRPAEEVPRGHAGVVRGQCEQPDEIAQREDGRDRTAEHVREVRPEVDPVDEGVAEGPPAEEADGEDEPRETGKRWIARYEEGGEGTDEQCAVTRDQQSELAIGAHIGTSPRRDKYLRRSSRREAAVGAGTQRRVDGTARGGGY